MSTYTKTNFIEGAAPGISAAELNKIGQGVADAHTEINQANTKIDDARKKAIGSKMYAYKNLGGTF